MNIFLKVRNAITNTIILANSWRENIMKKKHLLIHKAGLVAICLSCALSLSACGSKKSDMENKDPLTGLDQSDTQESGSDESSSEAGSDTATGDMGEFDAMLNDKNTDPNRIMDFINTNIVSAGISDVEHLFTGLLGFGDDIRNIDFARLEDSRQYMPEDMIAFMDLMKIESEKPSMVMSDTENRRVINMTLSEMLERAVLFEQHLKKYPDNVTTDAASRIYQEIATNAISGGYDKEQGISHFYKGDSDDVVDKESLQYYQKFATANADTNIGKIVQEYITTLQSNQFQINDTLENFYTGLQARLDVNKWAKDGSTGGNGSTGNTAGTNTNGTTGTNTNTNETNNGGTTGTNPSTNGANTNGNTAGTNTNETNNSGTTSTDPNTNGTNNNGNTAGTNNNKNENNSSAFNTTNTTNKGTNVTDTVIEGTISR